MSSYTLRPWTDVVELHPDVESDNLTESVFAIDVGAIAANDKRVPHVNRDAEAFFRATYLTADLKRLLEEVLASLAGAEHYNRVLKLRTPFGGGKSHTLAALLHAVRERKALNVIPEAAGLADPGQVTPAVFDGEKFSAQGKELPGGRYVHTMWGLLAAQLGDEAYAAIESLDRDRVAPSGDDIQKMLAGGPKLILLDEVLKYMERTAAVAVHDSTLSRQAKDFFQNLTVEVANSKNAVMIYSLQWSAKESLDNVALLNELDHLASRVDDLRQPVGDDEIVYVIKRRLLAKEPNAAHAAEVARIFQDVVTKQRRASASAAAEQEQAETEGARLRDQIKIAYPFHPATLDVMRGRWTSVPAFQRTRGALRFIAACLRSVKKRGPAGALLGPGDIPLHDAEVRNALYKELGLHNDYDPIFFEDLVGPNARVKRIDDRFAKEAPALANVKPATRLATAILMYSFGGLRRQGGGEDEMLPPGISEQELLSICLGPDLDGITASAVLADLRTTLVYLHYDGVRYVFKKDPNVTKLIEEAEDQIAVQEAQSQVARKKIKELLVKKLAGHRAALVWPDKSIDMPDRDASFLLAYLSPEFAEMSSSEQQKMAKDFFQNFGDRQRRFRNGLGLAIPQVAQVNALRRAVRYLLAVEKVEASKTQHRLTKEQLDQLRERRRTEETAIEYAFRELYTAVWLPRIESGQIQIEKVELGGRALAAPGMHERMMELLMAVSNKVFGTLTPRKIVELLKLGDLSGEGESPRTGIKLSDVQDSFYSILGFTRLENSGVLRKAISRGVESVNPEFGYWSGPEPALGAEGRYQVNRDRVVFGRSLDPVEVDFESGFLIMPAAMPLPPQQPAPIDGDITTPPPTSAEGDTGTGTGQVPPVISPTPPLGPGVQNSVHLSFRADRDKLFAAWNAISNLADEAGEVSVEIIAEKSGGFDRSWLRNAVYEPLEEADILESN
ncbi:MAG: ATP-binding protein [Pyrinomonadaceae bacterium]